MFVCLILDLQGHICMLRRKIHLPCFVSVAGFTCSLPIIGFPFPILHVPKEGKRIDFTVFSTDKDWLLCSYHWKQNPIVIWLIGTLWSLIWTILHLTFCVKCRPFIYSWKSLYNKRTFFWVIWPISRFNDELYRPFYSPKRSNII